MKKLLLCLFFCVLFSITIFAQKTNVPVIVTTQQANVRDEPNLQSKVVGTVKRGQKLAASAYRGNWIYVSNGSLRGWIHGTTIKSLSEPSHDNFDSFIKKRKGAIEDYSEKYKDEWLYYVSSETAHYYYNPAKVKREGNLVSAWIEERDKNDGIVLSKDLMQIDCRAQKFRTLVGVKYYSFTIYPNRKERYKLTTPESHEPTNPRFSTIIPDSIGESLADTICSL